MSEMIERCARALTGTLRHHGVEMHPDDIRGLVRDVVVAMREPGDDMALAGAKAGVEQIYYKCNAWERCVEPEFRGDHLNYAKYAWQAMIAEALKQ